MFWRGSREGPKNWSLSREGKRDFAMISRTLARSDVSKEHIFGYKFGDHLGGKIVEIGIQRSSKQSRENIHPNLVIVGSILGTIWEWACGTIALKTES